MLDYLPTGPVFSKLKLLLWREQFQPREYRPEWGGGYLWLSIYIKQKWKIILVFFVQILNLYNINHFVYNRLQRKCVAFLFQPNIIVWLLVSGIDHAMFVGIGPDINERNLKTMGGPMRSSSYYFLSNYDNMIDLADSLFETTKSKCKALYSTRLYQKTIMKSACVFCSAN